MSVAISTALEPRKIPVQARSAVTVEAIAEATIQVLLSHGAERLTTTRVAERAGVSVGTLYQYYPNKQSLLFAVVEDHLEKLAAAIADACVRAHHQPLSEMVKKMVEAFVDAKMKRADISAAICRIAPGIGGSAMLKRTTEHLQQAIEAMIQTAPDANSLPEKFTLEMMLAAMSGVMRYALQPEASPEMVRNLREHLVLLCQSYMAVATTGRR